MQLFLGIDGGGTRTTAWVADESGKVLAKAVAGPSNPLKVGSEACEREILRAANAAVAAVSDRRKGAAGLSRHGAFAQNLSRHGTTRKIGGIKPHLLAVVIGLAGVDRPPVHERLARWLRKTIPASRHLLTSDAAIALYAAVGNAPGVIVISGTGSIAYAQDELGRVFRCGGWGAPFDDAGSGYDIGRKAIVAALRDYDGRGKHTVLGRKICRAFRLSDITQIVLKALAPQDIAGLFPLVLDAARRGDPLARKIMGDAGGDLADLVTALVHRLGWKGRPFDVVCAGGVFSRSPRIEKAFRGLLRRFAPRARVMRLSKPPVEGALALARQLAQ